MRTTPVSMSTETSAIWTPDSARVQSFVLSRIVLAFLRDLVHAEFLARLLPVERFVGIRLVANAAVYCFQLIGRDIQRRRHLIEQFVECVDGGFADGSGNAADGCRSA